MVEGTGSELRAKKKIQSEISINPLELSARFVPKPVKKAKRSMLPLLQSEGEQKSITQALQPAFPDLEPDSSLTAVSTSPAAPSQTDNSETQPLRREKAPGVPLQNMETLMATLLSNRAVQSEIGENHTESQIDTENLTPATCNANNIHKTKSRATRRKEMEERVARSKNVNERKSIEEGLDLKATLRSINVQDATPGSSILEAATPLYRNIANRERPIAAKKHTLLKRYTTTASSPIRSTFNLACHQQSTPLVLAPTKTYAKHAYTPASPLQDKRVNPSARPKMTQTSSPIPAKRRILIPMDTEQERPSKKPRTPVRQLTRMATLSINGE
jgi:hypothetical protein